MTVCVSEPNGCLQSQSHIEYIFLKKLVAAVLRAACKGALSHLDSTHLVAFAPHNLRMSHWLCPFNHSTCQKMIPSMQCSQMMLLLRKLEIMQQLNGAMALGYSTNWVKDKDTECRAAMHNAELDKEDTDVSKLVLPMILLWAMGAVHAFTTFVQENQSVEDMPWLTSRETKGRRGMGQEKGDGWVGLKLERKRKERKLGRDRLRGTKERGTDAWWKWVRWREERRWEGEGRKGAWGTEGGQVKEFLNPK